MKFSRVQGVKAIKLTNGKYATVDAKDYEWLNSFKWYADFCKCTGKYYAVRFVKRKKVYMHRMILNLTVSTIQVDHCDRDQLNNCRNNLRECSHSQNQHNRIANKNNTSGSKGVTWDKSRNKWMVQIHFEGKRYYLGRFTDFNNAVNVRNIKEMELFKEFLAK